MHRERLRRVEAEKQMTISKLRLLSKHQVKLLKDELTQLKEFVQLYTKRTNEELSSQTFNIKTQISQFAIIAKSSQKRMQVSQSENNNLVS